MKEWLFDLIGHLQWSVKKGCKGASGRSWGSAPQVVSDIDTGNIVKVH